MKFRKTVFFKAWSSSEAVSKWFGLDPNAKTSAEVDFCEGGVYVLKFRCLYSTRCIQRNLAT